MTLPDKFIDSINKHIAISFGPDVQVAPLFYGQTALPHQIEPRGHAVWQAAVVRLHSTFLNRYVFYIGETDEQSGAFGVGQDVQEPLDDAVCLAGFMAGHQAIIHPDSLVEVRIDGEILPQLPWPKQKGSA